MFSSKENNIYGVQFHPELSGVLGLSILKILARYKNEREKNNKIILDKQFDALPNKIEFCANCVVSNQRPRTYFNSEGVCSACQWAFEKDYIVDWASREKELEKLCDLYRRNDGRFDVVVPGSGGKDSAFVAHQLRDRYGMNPLCVTWAPFDWTNIGWKI